MKKLLLLLLPAVMLSTLSSGQAFVSTGTSKYVLLEVATGNWSGYAPDAHQDVMQSIMPPSIPRAIVVEWHNNYSSTTGIDAMTMPGDPFCLGTGYIFTFPSATIDRATIGTTIAQNRPWEVKTNMRTFVAPSFQVDMNSSFNPATRLLTVTITGKALASLTGIWNLNAFVVEDSLASVGTGYTQTSLLTSVATATNGMPGWFYGLGNPLPAASYSHMNVARKILAPGDNIWGESVFTNPATGAVASRTYTYTVPASFNTTYMKVIGLVQKYGTLTGDREVENAIMSRVRLMPPGGTSAAATLFTAYTTATCSGADFYIATASYSSGLSIKSEFGDGSVATNTVLSATIGGYAPAAHSYATPGTYTVKHTLISGTAHIDSVSYSYAYRLCNQLSARHYFDANSNCTYDGSPDVLLSMPITTEIDSNGIPVDTITSLSGFYYTAYGAAGDVYTMKVLSSGASLVTSCPTTGMLYDTLLPSPYSLPANDFGFNCSGSTAFDLSVTSSTRAYATRLTAQILAHNSHCTPVTGTLKMIFSPKYIYATASVPPTTISGTELTWNISGMSSVTPQTVINVTLFNGPGGLLPTFDTVNTFYSIAPTGGDADITNNNRHELDSAIGSYDPNYVEVSPSYCLPTGVSELEYTIGFENMGGDTAHNIYVLDTISNNLDLATIRPISASHTMNIFRYTSGSYNIVKFDFPNIKLPDSSHHNLCHGMVQYKIKTKNLSSIGVNIPARAGIYFDVNPVVMTNTTNNSICYPVNVPVTNQTSYTDIFPNPATDELTISTEQSTFTSFIITNAVGKQVMTRELTGTQTHVSIKALPAGVYYVTLRGETRREVKKLVKI